MRRSRGTAHLVVYRGWGAAAYRPRGEASILVRPGVCTRAAGGRWRRLRLALIVRWHGAEIDRRLAAGEPPWTDDALALRARQITAPRSRERLAGGLAGALRSARNGAPGFTAAVRPHRADVLDAQALIGAIERRLREAGPVAAQGVAMISSLLIDGNGPLYRPGEPGTLGSRLRAAAAALQATDPDG